jgi:hypothetical protein
MIGMTLAAVLAGTGANHYPEIDRSYAVSILLITVVYALSARFGPRWIAQQTLVTSPELRRLGALQSWCGVALFLLVVTLPALLIWAAVIPSGANIYGLWIFILYNPLSSFWLGRKMGAETKAVLSHLREGPLPPGISERVAALVWDGKFFPAMMVYRQEHPGAKLKDARNAIKAYVSGGATT